MVFYGSVVDKQDVFGLNILLDPTEPLEYLLQAVKGL